MTWKIVKLGSVCDLKNGFAFKSRLFKEKGLPILRISNIQNEKIDTRRPVYFDVKDYKIDFKKYEVNNGDLLIAMSGATTGKIGFNETQTTFYLNQRVGKLVPGKNLDKKYLYYFLSTKIEANLKISKGAAQPNLSSEQIKNIEIGLPPLLEQQHIVAKLDAVFAEIDKIKKFEEIRIKKNETLIQNFLDNIFTGNNNLHKLSDCTQINPLKSEVNDLDDATEVSFIPMKDMGINNKLTIPNQKRKLKDVKGSYTYFSEGDILLAKITPCFENGKMGIASNLLSGIGFGSSEYVVFRPNKKLKNDWLYYFLNRNSFRIDGARNMSGAVGHKRVNKDFIGNSLIPIPSIKEQEKILFTLKSLSYHSEVINKIILKKKDEINHLKNSILNRLLNNKLVDAA